MHALLPYAMVSLMLLLLALVIWLKSRRIGEAEHISQRLEGMVEEAARARLNWLQQQFERAGLNPENSRIALIVCFAVPLLLMIFSAKLGFGAFIFLGMAMYFFLQWSYHKRMEKIIRQLPRFLDHVVRGLYTGRTLGDAMFSAQEEVQDPLYDIIGKVKRNVSLGVALPDSFQEVADRYAVKELKILALGIRVNARYGGNMSDLISNIIRFINEREKLAGQLRAMTGETRLSAGVLAVVPSAIAAYIMIMNPTYITSMWNDPSGRNWILFALALQCSGIMVIWRMMRSI
ncbi:MAG: type II secretion system F family protein [Pedobacter sp.]|nr:type II secretion system F family protein [Pedobacter sp.]